MDRLQLVLLLGQALLVVLLALDLILGDRVWLTVAILLTLALLIFGWVRYRRRAA